MCFSFLHPLCVLATVTKLEVGELLAYEFLIDLARSLTYLTVSFADVKKNWHCAVETINNKKNNEKFLIVYIIYVL